MQRQEFNRRNRMFKGVTRSILIISALMLGAPALMLYAEGGSEWWQQMQLMSPFF
jgi:hypothetical protein